MFKTSFKTSVDILWHAFLSVAPILGWWYIANYKWTSFWNARILYDTFKALNRWCYFSMGIRRRVQNHCLMGWFWALELEHRYVASFVAMSSEPDVDSDFVRRWSFHYRSPLTSLMKYTKFYAWNQECIICMNGQSMRVMVTIFNHWRKWKPREKAVVDFQNLITTKKQTPTVWLLFRLGMSWEPKTLSVYR